MRKCLACTLALIILMMGMLPVTVRAETDATEYSTEAPLETTVLSAETTEQPGEIPSESTELPTEIPVETTEPATEPPQETQPETPSLDTGAWNLYVGQLHAHTVDSDGRGTVTEAFHHAAQVEGLDFFAVTDHSDSFDNDKAGTLTQNGASVSQNWADGKAAAQSVTDEDFVGIYGFEISWNQGQGHMSTFNTPGFLSRDRDGYKLYRDGMENYYAALLEVPNSVSQFNHPGTFYGDFKDFRYVSPQVDQLVTLIEVGSGAGREYQTSYDYYNRALDQGWHLSPTNNQNNHTGNFGDADTNRTVVLAKSLTEAGIYDALRNYRTYATEDSDLQIYYTLNGRVMGSELPEADVGASVSLSVKLLDVTDGQQGLVEVITTGGAVAASAVASEHVEFSLPPAAYYYIRVTQPDGDVAVTAPVWIRQQEDLGLESMYAKTSMTRAGDPQTICLQLYNNESEDLTITSVSLKDAQGNALASWEETLTLAQFAKEEIALPICMEKDGIYVLTATVSAVFRGENREFTENLELMVLPRALTGDVLIDGSHGGETDFRALEELVYDRQMAAHVETIAVTREQLAQCSLLIIPAPESTFEEDFLNLIRDYVNQGGDLLLLGTAGGSSELNRLLQALGASMTLNADTAQDAVSNGGAPDQIFTAQFTENPLTQGILEGQVYAHVGGCTLNAAENLYVVRSRLGDVLLAAEGNILLAGSNFLADEWLVLPEHPLALPYGNRTLMENLLGLSRTLPEITQIGAVRQGTVGSIYLVEGVVTAGTANPNTLFPDAIYIQDASGGIAAVRCGDHILELGRRVRIIGSLEIWDGNPQLRIGEIQLLNKEKPIKPQVTDNALNMAVQGGQLLKVKGKVVSASYQDAAVLQFQLKDASGSRVTVWVEDTILSGSLGKNVLSKIVRKGNEVSAVGFAHLRDGKAVLRLRDCDEVILLSVPPVPTTKPAETTVPPKTTGATEPTEETTVPTELPAEPTEAPEETTVATRPIPTDPTENETVQTEPTVSVPTIGGVPNGETRPFPWWALILLILSMGAWVIKNMLKR